MFGRVQDIACLQDHVPAGGLGRPIEREKPLPVIRLHDNDLVDGNALDILRPAGAQGFPDGGPCEPFVLHQHGAAPVEVRGAWHIAIWKFNTECDFVRQCEGGDAAGGELIGHAGAVEHGVIQLKPEWAAAARKKKEHDGDERHRRKHETKAGP